MLDIVLIGFFVLTALIFIFAFADKRPPPAPPPSRGATLLIEWSVTNAQNVPSQGQITIDEANLRQLASASVSIGADTYAGPSLGTVLNQAGIAYSELIFTSAPPTNPLSKAQANSGAWIIATARNGAELRGVGQAFQLANDRFTPPLPRLLRIFAR